MLKSRAKRADTTPEASRHPGEWIMLGLAVVLPIAAICVVGGGITSALATSWPIYLAAPVGFLCAIAFVLISICSNGNDLMDAIVGSAIILLLCAVLFPVFANARRQMEERQKRKMPTHQQTTTHVTNPTFHFRSKTI